MRQHPGIDENNRRHDKDYASAQSVQTVRKVDGVGDADEPDQSEGDGHPGIEIQGRAEGVRDLGDDDAVSYDEAARHDLENEFRRPAELQKVVNHAEHGHDKKAAENGQRLRLHELLGYRGVQESRQDGRNGESRNKRRSSQTGDLTAAVAPANRPEELFLQGKGQDQLCEEQSQKQSDNEQRYEERRLYFALGSRKQFVDLAHLLAVSDFTHSLV